MYMRHVTNGRVYLEYAAWHLCRCCWFLICSAGGVRGCVGGDTVKSGFNLAASEGTLFKYKKHSKIIAFFRLRPSPVSMATISRALSLSLSLSLSENSRKSLVFCARENKTYIKNVYFVYVFCFQSNQQFSLCVSFLYSKFLLMRCYLLVSSLLWKFFKEFQIALFPNVKIALM